ncbi:MAG: metalloenzyme [Planctomycetota bacterium]|nr:metalloenzyme [Planctomycetota bacterium]
MNPLIWLVLDSCRYDSFVRAAKPNFDAFAAASGAVVERRWSYASFTAPSHYAFLMGLTPHRSPMNVLASEVYRSQFEQWSERLGVERLDFGSFLPHLSLPRVLKGLGYRTIGRVSLPVLNEATLISSHFDDYRLMADHADFAGMLREIDFSPGPGLQSTFHFLNLGETHYPYRMGAELPRLSGVHGTLRHMGDPAADDSRRPAFAPAALKAMHDQQSRCVENVDLLFAQLLERCPRGTHVIITADHGELFGEDGYFGHGPIMHPLVFEVPFLEGRVR